MYVYNNITANSKSLPPPPRRRDIRRRRRDRPAGRLGHCLAAAADDDDHRDARAREPVTGVAPRRTSPTFARAAVSLLSHRRHRRHYSNILLHQKHSAAPGSAYTPAALRPWSDVCRRRASS